MKRIFDICAYTLLGAIMFVGCARKDNPNLSRFEATTNGPNATSVSSENSGAPSATQQGADRSVTPAPAARKGTHEADAPLSAAAGNGEVPEGKAAGEIQNVNGGRTSSIETSVTNTPPNTPSASTQNKTETSK